MERATEKQPVITRSYFWGSSEKRLKCKGHRLGTRTKMLQYSKEFPIYWFLVAVLLFCRWGKKFAVHCQLKTEIHCSSSSFPRCRGTLPSSRASSRPPVPTGAMLYHTNLSVGQPFKWADQSKQRGKKKPRWWIRKGSQKTNVLLVEERKY